MTFDSLCNAQLKRSIPWVALVAATFIFVKDGLEAGTMPAENYIAYATCLWIAYSPQWAIHILTIWKNYTPPGGSK